MKIRLHFKTPDVVYNALAELYDNRQEADDEDGVEVDVHYSVDEDEDADSLKALIERYVKYGECLTVEFDSETGSVYVVPID